MSGGGGGGDGGCLTGARVKSWPNYFVIFGLIVVLQIIQMCVVSADGPNCMQKGTGPKDLYMSNGAMNSRYQWYRVGQKTQVPVVLDSAYSHRERQTILGGLGEIQEKTCVDFYVFNHTGALHGYDYVYITKAREGCWSHVGRIGRGQQEISLARGCINHRTAVHEMIHALGFTHEHVRSDRDKYVRIHWGNIMPGRERNFIKRDTKGRDPYGPYDYASIMHYDRRAFSVNREDTIEPLKQPGVKIGLGQTMSYWDVKRILKMYKCGDSYGDYGDYSGSNHLGSPEYDEHDHHGPETSPGYQQNELGVQDYPENHNRQSLNHHEPGHHHHHHSPNPDRHNEGGHYHNPGSHHQSPGGHHHNPGSHHHHDLDYHDDHPVVRDPQHHPILDHLHHPSIRNQDYNIYNNLESQGHGQGQHQSHAPNRNRNPQQILEYQRYPNPGTQYPPPYSPGASDFTDSNYQSHHPQTPSSHDFAIRPSPEESPAFGSTSGRDHNYGRNFLDFDTFDHRF